MRQAIWAILSGFALSFLTLSAPALAEDRVTLGWGRLFTNDALGDGHDRWRTGSYAVSRLRGLHWSGSLPTTPGEVLELRFRADTMAPASLMAPSPADRRHVGATSLGLGTHFAAGGFDIAAMTGVTITGPITGLGLFSVWRARHSGHG